VINVVSEKMRIHLKNISSVGGKRGGETSKLRGDKRRENYYKNPKRCKRCGTPILYDRQRNDYCSHSCGGIYNNLGKIRNRFCLYCGKELIRNPKAHAQTKKFCDVNCQTFYNFEIRIKGGFHITPSCARLYYIAKRGHVCEDCHLTTWKGKPIPLELHHENGDFDDNTPENVKLMCRNCHAFTETFGVKNTGKGRRINSIRKRNLYNPIA
jgi:predicted nucleic acid-binding Zn ribbon protein